MLLEGISTLLELQYIEQPMIIMNSEKLYSKVTLVQSVLISYSEKNYILTPEDLPSSSSLLVYFAPVVQNSYIHDNRGGQESFILARSLYNAFTNYNYIDSKVIISYINKNNCYNALKNNLSKWVYQLLLLKTWTNKDFIYHHYWKLSSQREIDTNLENLPKNPQATHVNDEDDSSISNAAPTEPSQINLQNTNLASKDKHSRPLHHAKK
ncbi:hypothetical protein F8M41_005133 [Gigaspora margarita]|uniref:Uncharacterized protein n=1 Tax=Gigaspora margarita TaxID=4874 RepID=A0A8H3X9B3_GIGMA|nr:hypothetical protein F8M41_005133 [Gigaspora margarita]